MEAVAIRDTTLRRLAARTTSTCFTYRVTGLAAEAAFFAILSLPPLVFGLAGTIGYVAQSYDVAQIDLFKNRVLYMASQVITPTTVDELIAPTLDEVLSGGRFDVVSLGFVLALWSGSRALNVFIDTITIMYGLGGKRGIVKTRMLSFGLYVVGLLLGMFLIPLLLAGPELVVKAFPHFAGTVHILYWPVLVILSVCFLTTLYHVSVPVRTPWREDIPGLVDMMLGGQEPEYLRELAEYLGPLLHAPGVTEEDLEDLIVRCRGYVFEGTARASLQKLYNRARDHIAASYG